MAAIKIQHRGQGTGTGKLSRYRNIGGHLDLTLCDRACPDALYSAQVSSMYHHVKKLMYPVRVDEPDPKFGNMVLEQFGGANGKLEAAMQYSIQGLNCDDPGRKTC